MVAAPSHINIQREQSRQPAHVGNQKTEISQGFLLREDVEVELNGPDSLGALRRPSDVQSNTHVCKRHGSHVLNTVAQCDMEADQSKQSIRAASQCPDENVRLRHHVTRRTPRRSAHSLWQPHTTLSCGRANAATIYSSCIYTLLHALSLRAQAAHVGACVSMWWREGCQGQSNERVQRQIAVSRFIGAHSGIADQYLEHVDGRRWRDMGPRIVGRRPVNQPHSVPTPQLQKVSSVSGNSHSAGNEGT